MTKPLELTHPETKETKPLISWAVSLHVDPRTLRQRLQKGQDWWRSPVEYRHDRALENPETGEVLTVKEWSDRLKIPLKTLEARIRRDAKGESRKRWCQQTKGDQK